MGRRQGGDQIQRYEGGKEAGGGNVGESGRRKWVWTTWEQRRSGWEEVAEVGTEVEEVEVSGGGGGGEEELSGFPLSLNPSSLALQGKRMGE